MRTTREGNVEYFLGVNTGPHDASAAIVRDGEVLAMIEQERISRNRHAFEESPARAVAACLREVGVSLDQITAIGVGWNVPELAELEGVSFHEQDFVNWMVGDTPRATNPSLVFVDHHLAHAASAFYTSGMDEAAIIVADGRGERVSTTVAVGSGSGITVLGSRDTRESLGHYYGWASEWAGLGLWGTGKLMGLASYGQPCQAVPLVGAPDGYQMKALPPDGTPVSHHFALHRRELRRWFRANNYPFTSGTASDAMGYADFAASVQASLEAAILGLAAHARRETGLRKLAFAGGVALNCSANGVLIGSGIFDEVWVPPFPHDAGVAVGAAMVAAGSSVRQRPPSRLASAFLAPETEGMDVELLASVPDLEVAQLDDPDLVRNVASAIADGAVVGWFQGRAEVGQRALGARSILCDPRRRGNLAAVNEIKGREPWRPLAPVVLREHFSAVFDQEVPLLANFMLAALPVRADAARMMPAAVHVDATARPQAVDPSNGRYFDLVSAFAELTGVPALVNTSLNVGGQPIAYTPRDALQTFLDGRLDALVVNDLLISRCKARVRRMPENELRALSFTPWTRSA